ncbi:MAG TPA: hypothetical protein VL984_13410 [Acidimicrobiales bacterium]|nr:hypothetical protein [Acidimicrobiales bacterium]
MSVAGHRGDQRTARAGLGDRTPEVRASALAALARMGRLQVHELRRALSDPAPAVRRRACEVAAAIARPGEDGAKRRPGPDELGELPVDIAGLLSDSSPPVVEAACYALGELGEGAGWGASAVPGAGPASVGPLALTATSHPDPLCREAAVAALGALALPAGLAAVLSGLGDKPAVRRRAVIALAPFEGAEVEAALARALEDRDWQVRQVAEDLVGNRSRKGHAPGTG